MEHTWFKVGGLGLRVRMEHMWCRVYGLGWGWNLFGLGFRAWGGD